MPEIKGLVGLRPNVESVKEVTSPPYDVIKPDTKLEKYLKSLENSIFHVILGNEPLDSLNELINNNKLVEDEEPCFYVYEQKFGNKSRTGLFAAVEVSEYKEKNIIRHEKTFDEKVKGRMELRNETEYSFGPVFTLTKSPINSVLEEIKKKYDPLYSFVSDFDGESDLDSIENKIYRIQVGSEEGKKLSDLIEDNPLYIADGHHRYHTSLLNKQSHFLSYICEKAEILAYNRVINGNLKFDEILDKIDAEKVAEFKTPEKNSFSIYTKKGTYEVKAKEVPGDVVGRLDCSILERELYPVLGLSHDMIMNHDYFDYYSEGELDKMRECVDTGKYDMAVALHPVSIDELMAVADAGLENPDIVMPEKSTFFSPKILTGLFVYKHNKK